MNHSSHTKTETGFLIFPSFEQYLFSADSSVSRQGVTGDIKSLDHRESSLPGEQIIVMLVMLPSQAASQSQISAPEYVMTWSQHILRKSPRKTLTMKGGNTFSASKTG